MTTWITICDTCKREGWDQGDMTHTDGERLADRIEQLAQARNDLKTRRLSCTMGCVRACNIGIQGDGKLSYVLGEFEPSEEAASAIVDYAALHAQSDTGQVPYKAWPQGVKGHFVNRLPPLPDEK